MSSDVEGSAVTTEAPAADAPAEKKLGLQVTIENKGKCLRHISVVVPGEDIQDIREDVLIELREKAQVPGFRPGKVPDALLLRRFREEITGDIKQKVLLVSLEQISEEHKIDPLGEPRLNLQNLHVPETGDFHYEFDVEVRPDFELPDFSAMTLSRPSGEVTEEEVAVYIENLLDSRAEEELKEGEAAPGDAVNCTISYSWSGGEIPGTTEEYLTLLRTLDFPDATLDGFDTLMTGVKAGETRTATVTISSQSPVVEMRGEQVTVHFAVTAVYAQIPATASQFFEEWDCADEEGFKAVIQQRLQNQMAYQQRQSLRNQLLEKISEAADWELPEGLVRQQTDNALRRELLEMHQAGFTREQIRARETQMRQNALADTEAALKQHFVLDKLATRENIEATEEAVAMELTLMAMQSGESPRRLRARLAKTGMIENLYAQLRERSAVDWIMERVQCEDVPHTPITRNSSSSVRTAICQNMRSSLVDDAAAESE